MPILLPPKYVLTEARVREIAEEVAVKVARRIRFGFVSPFETNPPMVYPTVACWGHHIVMDGDAERYNALRASILEVVEEAAGRTLDGDNGGGDLDG